MHFPINKKSLWHFANPKSAAARPLEATTGLVINEQRDYNISVITARSGSNFSQPGTRGRPYLTFQNLICRQSQLGKHYADTSKCHRQLLTINQVSLDLEASHSAARELFKDGPRCWGRIWKVSVLPASLPGL